MNLYGERLAVVPIYETQTKGGLSLPQGSSKRVKGDTLRGRVAFVSDETTLDQNNVPIRHVPNIVDRIVHYYAGHIFEAVIDETTYHIIDMGTLLCVED